MSEGPVILDSEWQRLDPRYPRMARERAWIRLLVWGGTTAALVWLITWVAPPVATRVLIVIAACWAVPMALLAVLWFRLPVLRYRHSSWRLSDESLDIRSGAWWFSEIRVPRSRIQHTDVSQGPIERRHGLGHLVVYTAGTHHSEIKLGGIAHETAIAIRDQLLPSGRHAPV